MQAEQLHPDYEALGLAPQEGRELLPHIIMLIAIAERCATSNCELDEAICALSPCCGDYGLEAVPAYLSDPAYHGSVSSVLDHFKKAGAFRVRDRKDPYKDQAAWLMEYLPNIKNPKDILNILCRLFTPLSKALLVLYKILECSDSYEQYQESFGEQYPLSEADYDSVAHAARDYSINESFFAINKDVGKICEQMGNTHFPVEEQLRVIAEVNRHIKNKLTPHIKFPAAFASKLLYGDSKTVAAQLSTQEFEAILKDFPTSRVPLAQYCEVILRRKEQLNIPPTCGFVLPFVQSLAGDGIALVVNAWPSIVKNWKTSTQQPAYFMVTSAQGREMMKRSYPHRQFYAPNDLSKKANISSMILMGTDPVEKSGNQELQELSQTLVSFPAQPKLIVFLPDSQFHTLCTLLPQPYALTKLCIMPLEMFKHEPKKRVIAVFEPNPADVNVKVWYASHYRDTKRSKSYIKEVGSVEIMIPASAFVRDPSPRKVYDRYKRAAERKHPAVTQGLIEEPMTRIAADPVAVTKELTVYCQSNPIPDGNRKVAIYLKSNSVFPQSCQPRKNKELDENTRVWRASISEDKIPHWIHSKGVFKKQLREAAVDRIRGNCKGKQLTLQTLYYCLYDSLSETGNDGKALLRIAVWDGELGKHTVKDLQSEDWEGYYEEVGQTPDGTSQLKGALQELLELAYQERLVSAADATPLISEFTQSIQRERSVYALRRKTYTAEEERKMIEYLLDKDRGKKDLGAAKALGALIVLLTGLPFSVVTALCWGDFVESESNGYHQLLIYKNTSTSGSLKYFHANKCRRIPIMSLLASEIEAYQTWMLRTGRYKGEKISQTSEEADISDDSGDVRPEDFKKRRMLLSKGQPLTYSQLKAAYKRAEEKAEIPEEEVVLAGSKKRVDLSKYKGSRARENFINRCSLECGMDESEISFLVLNQLPDTLNRNYIDQHFVCRQECMIEKLDRWGRRYTNSHQVNQHIPLEEQVTECMVEPGIHRDAKVILDIVLEGDAVITFDPPHGSNFQIIISEELI